MGEDIRCRCCGSTMDTDRSECERTTTTRWHSCATCGHVRMTSHREDVVTTARRDKARVEDDVIEEMQPGFEF